MYSDKYDLDYFTSEVEKICPTARLITTGSANISKEEFQLNNLENLVLWNKRLAKP